MKKLVFTVAFLSVTDFGFAQTNDFKQDVLKMMEVSGANASQEELIKNQILPMVAEEKRADLKKDVQAVFGEINSDVADLYMKKFTHDEVKEILKFYESPVGKKMSEVTPEITSESMKAGEKHNMKFQQIIMKYMN